MEQSLTEAVLSYQKTGKNWSEISERICLFVYEFPRKWTKWDSDRCSDFFLSFLPRVPGLVQRYKPHYSFETYLRSSLRWHINTYVKEFSSTEHYIAWTEIEGERRMKHLEEHEPLQVGDFISQYEEPLPEGPFDLDEKGRLKDFTLRRRVLSAILLHSADINTKKIGIMAQLVGVEVTWLENTIEEANRRIRDKVDRRNHLRQRRNECWYLMEAAQKHMSNNGNRNKQNASKWNKKIRTWRKRYKLASESLKNMKVSLSHQDIAELLELPVGTVASGLHYLRKTWQIVAEREVEEQKLSSQGVSAHRRQQPKSEGKRRYKHGPLDSHISELPE